MKSDPEKQKAEFLTEAEALFDEMMAWEADTPAPDLAQIEGQVLALRKRLSERLAETLLEQQESRQPAEVQTCPECGGELVNKGLKPNQVTSRLGTLKLVRTYYYCPRCRAGVFPPGSAVEGLGETLE